MTSKTEIAWVAAKLSTPSHKIYWALKQENYSRQVSLHFWILTVLTGGRQALLWGDICHPGAGLRTRDHFGLYKPNSFQLSTAFSYYYARLGCTSDPEVKYTHCWLPRQDEPIPLQSHFTGTPYINRSLSWSKNNQQERRLGKVIL